MAESLKASPGKITPIILLDKIKDQFKPKDETSLRTALEDALAETTNRPSSEFSVSERTMLNNILRFGALRVEDVMVPRADIKSIDEDAPIGELLQLFSSAGHSRIPLFRETLDDPVGMVHVKDLMEMIAEIAGRTLSLHEQDKKDKNGANTENAKGKGKNSGARLNHKNNLIAGLDFATPIKEAGIDRNVLYVPPSMPAVNLLLRMQTTRMHLALVVDEYGGTDGLVSIEDLIEEVVGDIEDEHDDQAINQVEGSLEDGLIASARTDLEDLEKFLGFDLKVDIDEDDIDTIGGLAVALSGRVPVRGEVISHPSGVEIEVLDADPRRIKLLKLTGTKEMLVTPKNRDKKKNKKEK